MRSLRLILASVAFVSLAACSEAAVPTGSVQPGTPSFDGTGMVGSGNRDASTTPTAEGDSTGTTKRGTGMVGSGN
jgi:hypothetical protein